MEKLVYSRATAVFVLTSLLRDDIISQISSNHAYYYCTRWVDLYAADSNKDSHRDIIATTNNVTEVLYLGSLHKWKVRSPP